MCFFLINSELITAERLTDWYIPGALGVFVCVCVGGGGRGAGESVGNS